MQKQWKRIVSFVKKNNADKNSSVKRTKQIRLMLPSNCAVCGKKNQSLLKIKKQANYWES